MKKYVVDTNVPIVANGRDDNASIDCRIAAVEFLSELVNRGTIVLDSNGEIQNQYHGYLNPLGAPGVGDRFYQQVINSHPQKVERIDIRKRPDGEYEDLPQPILDAGFDPSDRVFAAVARKSASIVGNAVDSDWLIHRTVLEHNGVAIEFICGCDPARWIR